VIGARAATRRRILTEAFGAATGKSFAQAAESCFAE